MLKHIRLFLTIVVLVGSLTACSDRPSIILVSLDTLRAANVGAYGYKRPTTPNLDRLAAEGVLFERFYAQTHFTLPSHTTMLTGAPAEVHKVVRSALGKGPTGPSRFSLILPPKIPTIAQQLKQNGYTSAWFAHSADQDLPFTVGLGRGFTDFFPLGIDRRPGMQLAKEWLKSRGTDPFFAFLHSKTPHSPYFTIDGTDKFVFSDLAYSGGIPSSQKQLDDLIAKKSRYLEVEAKGIVDWLSPRTPLPSDLLRSTASINPAMIFWSTVDRKNPRDLQRLTDLYDDAILRADGYLGEIIASLKEHGQYDRSWVIVLSDHGEELGEHGTLSHRTLNKNVVWIPLVIKPPKGFSFSPGLRVAAVTSMIDLMPTLLEAAGAKSPRLLPGRSLLPLIRGEQIPDQPAFSSILNPIDLTVHSYSVRTSEWTLRKEPGSNFMLFQSPTDQLEQRDLSATNPEKTLILKKQFEDYQFQLKQMQEAQ